jgi:nitrite reductase/ring-hydroxylating ferredoxin subunit/uncharacterized membrane protein
VRVRLSDRLEQAERLDRVVEPVQQAVRKLPPGRVRDALHGVWLGHPVHPVLVQVPVGAWMSAAFLDAIGRDEDGARHLIGLGLLASVPAAVAGSADWAEQHEQQMRTGVVHAAANTAAISLYAGSLLARARRRTGLGKALGYAGLAAVAVGGLLGGDISYRQAGGANHAEETPHLVPAGWQDLMPLADLTQGEPAKATLGEVPVFVLRDGNEVFVLANKCSHMSGPLSDGGLSGGELTGSRKDRCVSCPWHGSVFRVRDGAVVHGPATADQPAFETRIRAGIVQVCLPGAG